jgi:Zn-dependent peptidase ImmA (M78 family)
MKSGLQEEDYYMNDAGLLVFTEKYHLKRGYCCGNYCKHCPFQHINTKNKIEVKHARTTESNC